MSPPGRSTSPHRTSADHGQLASLGATAASRPRPAVTWSDVSAVAVGFTGVAAVAAWQGGYFPSAWGWLGMGACWISVLGLVLFREMVTSRLEVAAVAGALALAVWTAASSAWTSSTTLSMLDAERTVAYLAIFIAALTVCGRRSSLALLAGVLAAITLVALYALGTHLLPERFGVYVDQTQAGRLFQPVGYWNALGVFCAMGIALALGLVDRPGGMMLRAAAGASLPALTATTYFTFSRGAWAAAGIAIASVACLVPARLRYLTTMLVAAPVPALAVAYAASLRPLVSAHAAPAHVEASGARAALVLAAATATQAAVVVAVMLVQRRVRPSSVVRRVYSGVLVIAMVTVVAAAVAVTASRTSMHQLERQLTATPVNHEDLNRRLLSVSLTGRQLLWGAAVDQWRVHPAVGGGAGTFTTYWLQHRTNPQFVLDAHDLYLETLAELGVVGLLALALFLLPPLVASVRARADPLVPAALGAYVACIAHAVIDWDWEVPAVMTVALAAGAVLLAQARERGPVRVTTGWRAGLGLALGLVCALSGLGLVGNHALSAGSTALGDHRFKAALADADRAHRYAPWSDQPYILAGHADVGLNRRPAALRSFRTAVSKSPSDWVAWEGLAHVTTGLEHAVAMTRLLALDPLYDVANGRP